MKKADSSGRFSSKLIAMEWAHVWIQLQRRKMEEWCTAFIMVQRKSLVTLSSVFKNNKYSIRTNNINEKLLSILK